jgi:hypothetical protein
VRRLAERLLDRLGPAGTIRFLQQYEPGRGDYTRERQQWLGDVTLDPAVEAIERRRHEA